MSVFHVGKKHSTSIERGVVLWMPGSYLGVLLDNLEPPRSMRLLGIRPEKVLGPIGVRLGLSFGLLLLAALASSRPRHCSRCDGHCGVTGEGSRCVFKGGSPFFLLMLASTVETDDG